MLNVLTHQVNANKNYFKVPSGSEWPLSGFQIITHAAMEGVKSEIFIVLSVEVQWKSLRRILKIKTKILE